jgi:2,5-diamino-6-(ribosylamino)-4(3H)-pyrimidinone 5'-phosphate reductase
MRPHVIVNVAMSADGKLSTRERRQVRISGDEDFQRVDHLKADCDAVMVGIGTVLADDPSLTVKSPVLRKRRFDQGLDEHPIRIVVDSNARTPPDAAILHRGEGKRIVACSSRADPDRVRALEKHAAIIVAGEEKVDLRAVLENLSSMGICRLMVEGGGTLIWSLVSDGLVDEITCFIGNLVIGGKDAPTLADGPGFVDEDSFVRLQLHDITQMDEGILLHWKVICGNDTGGKREKTD